MEIIIILDYMNAFTGSLIAVLGIAFIPEIRKNRKRLFWAISLGILAFLVGILKINSDKTKDDANTVKIDHLDSTISIINERDSSLQDKIDSNNVFLKRLEKLGIKDSSNNPIINVESILFNANTIKDATSIESHNQKGGQTAREIINNK